MTPLVVDSWLVAGGVVRGLRRHLDRFRDGCAAMVPGLAPHVLDAFLGEVPARLPATGLWFPRIEAYPGDPPRLELRLRPAPASSDSLALWYPPAPDPRRHPTVKGPDLDTLAALRVRAVAAGADDAVLHTRDGIVLEAAHSALVWWRGDLLCVPDSGLPVLPSVTVGLLLAAAARQGTTVVGERCRVADLAGAEVWSANALHGLRTVSGLGHARPDPVRLAHFRGLVHGATHA